MNEQILNKVADLIDNSLSDEEFRQFYELMDMGADFQFNYLFPRIEKRCPEMFTTAEIDKPGIDE
jgi:hypothetical protein